MADKKRQRSNSEEKNSKNDRNAKSPKKYRTKHQDERKERLHGRTDVSSTNQISDPVPSTSNRPNTTTRRQERKKYPEPKRTSTKLKHGYRKYQNERSKISICKSTSRSSGSKHDSKSSSRRDNNNLTKGSTTDRIDEPRADGCWDGMGSSTVSHPTRFSSLGSMYCGESTTNPVNENIQENNELETVETSQHQNSSEEENHEIYSAIQSSIVGTEYVPIIRGGFQEPRIRFLGHSMNQMRPYGRNFHPYYPGPRVLPPLRPRLVPSS